MNTDAKALDRKILKFIERHRRNDTAPESEFNHLALEIFEYQFKRNENYRKYCLFEKKNPANIFSWKEIPAMPAMGFKELILSTFPVREAVKVFKTSGTTEQSHGAHFFDTLRLYDASAVPVFKKYLLPERDRILCFFLMASPAASPHSSLSYMMGVINRRFSGGRGKYYFENNVLKFKELCGDLRRAEKKEAILILSTAFSLKAFLDYLRSNKISFRFRQGSRLMETGGFKGRTKEVSKKRLYSNCEKFFGIANEYCVSEYGMTELSSQFYDTTLRDKISRVKRRSFKAGPPWLRMLVIDPKTGRETKNGRIGILRHFDLANRGSVIAVQTEDVGRAAGKGFELLGRLSGADLRGCSLSYEEFLAKS